MISKIKKYKWVIGAFALGAVAVSYGLLNKAKAMLPIGGTTNA